MRAAEEHITHTCLTSYEHLPYERRERVCRVFGISESSRQKRVARHTDARPMTVPEMLAGLEDGLLNEEFLADLLLPAGYGAYRIQGEHDPFKAHCEGLDYHSQHAMFFSDGEMDQGEKRLSIKRTAQYAAKLMGKLNWLKRTANIKSKVWAK